MRTRATAMLGVERPIFAFSDSRHVVVEISQTGGRLKALVAEG